MQRLVFVAILLATAAFRPATPPVERSAILISWDGAGGEHVRANLAKGELPHLAALVRQGALVDIEVTGHGTDTKSGHAQMPAPTRHRGRRSVPPRPRRAAELPRLAQAQDRRGR